MTQTSENIKFSVFGSKNKTAILVPEMPISVRNNCQSGKWSAIR